MYCRNQSEQLLQLHLSGTEGAHFLNLSLIPVSAGWWYPPRCSFLFVSILLYKSKMTAFWMCSVSRLWTVNWNVVCLLPETIFQDPPSRSPQYHQRNGEIDSLLNRLINVLLLRYRRFHLCFGYNYLIYHRNLPDTSSNSCLILHFWSAFYNRDLFWPSYCTGYKFR